MPNWTAITPDNLKALGHGNILTRASALAVGSVDPVTEAIADSTARVRRAISTGNQLDRDANKIPNSLRAVCARLALFALMERIGLALSDDQKDTRRDDISDLKRIADNKTKVELPDDPDASAEMQPSGRAVEAVNVPRRQTGRERTSGL